MTSLGSVRLQLFSPLGAARPDSRVINWYHGLCYKLVRKIPKSFNKHYDAASPAQGALGEDLFQESEHFTAGGPEAMALVGSCLQLPSEVAAETVFL